MPRRKPTTDEVYAKGYAKEVDRILAESPKGILQQFEYVEIDGALLRTSDLLEDDSPIQTREQNGGPQ
jgi:hypothetical protein